MKPAAPSLRQLQEWFVHAMTRGDTPADGAAEASALHAAPALDQLLTSSAERAALDRFSAYHHAYRARLVECLADDYPVLAHTLGPRFEALCLRYVAAHPSRSFSLNGYGRNLAAHLREDPTEDATFEAELAELEWALVEAVHAAGAPVLGLDAVQKVPPAAWEHAVLEPSPSLALLAFHYPVNAFYKQARETGPGAAPPHHPAPAPTAVAVCRRDAQVWRVDLSPSGHSALRALASGTALLPALTAADARPDDVTTWFRTWMECGFFSAVRYSRT